MSVNQLDPYTCRSWDALSCWLLFPGYGAEAARERCTADECVPCLATQAVPPLGCLLGQVCMSAGHLQATSHSHLPAL